MALQDTRFNEQGDDSGILLMVYVLDVTYCIYYFTFTGTNYRAFDNWPLNKSDNTRYWRFLVTLCVGVRVGTVGCQLNTIMVDDLNTHKSNELDWYSPRASYGRLEIELDLLHVWIFAVGHNPKVDSVLTIMDYTCEYIRDDCKTGCFYFYITCMFTM
jgi:hypothetical protein